MTLLSRLEQKIGFIAIAHLPVYIVSAQAILYLWCLLNPSQAHLLTLDPVAVQYGGEWWRLLTFAFVTPVQNPLFAIFFLYLVYIYGSTLENEWGSFQFTVFYGVGLLGTLAAGYYFGGYNGAFYLNTTIFLAFAALYPDFQLMFFFILPVKVKWLGWATWALIAYQAWGSPVYERAAILISVANYLLFFGKTHIDDLMAFFRRRIHKMKFRNWTP